MNGLFSILKLSLGGSNEIVGVVFFFFFFQYLGNAKVTGFLLSLSRL